MDLDQQSGPSQRGQRSGVEEQRLAAFDVDDQECALGPDEGAAESRQIAELVDLDLDPIARGHGLERRPSPRVDLEGDDLGSRKPAREAGRVVPLGGARDDHPLDRAGREV